MEVETVFIVIILVLLLLVTQRWFWVALFGIGALASLFATIASVIHFQILGALGFFFLTAICWFITDLIINYPTEEYEEEY